MLAHNWVVLTDDHFLGHCTRVFLCDIEVACTRGRVQADLDRGWLRHGSSPASSMLVQLGNSLSRPSTAPRARVNRHFRTISPFILHSSNIRSYMHRCTHGTLGRLYREKEKRLIRDTYHDIYNDGGEPSLTEAARRMNDRFAMCVAPSAS